MTQPIRSIIPAGNHGLVVEAECHLSSGLPTIVIVGLANKAIDEAKERIRSALASSHIPLPRKRITINLAPAGIHKDSTGLDLAMAVAILQYSGQITYTLDADHAVIGELGLDGSLRGVRGLIGTLLAGRAHGITTFFIPQANLPQALLVPDITVIPLQNIQELYLGLNKQKDLQRLQTGSGSPPSMPAGQALHHDSYDTELGDIAGQEAAKRALILAAAGGHNILLSGPPGTGKSMLARALPSLLPPLTVAEMLEVTHLHSLIGAEYERLVTLRPFRSPHHSASHLALIGGSGLRPGEISLSHHGVLLLDELPEFSRQSLEALRQPLEDRRITITKVRETTTYPANFILVATANPCPCGYFGSSKPCECPPHRIAQYRQRLSGPILDRIDLYVDVSEVKHADLLGYQPDPGDTRQTKQLVAQARARQRTRFGGIAMLNAAMTNKDIVQKSLLAPEAKAILNQAAERLQLSARSYMRVIKVGRTVADLTSSKHITAAHIAEALRYRPNLPA